MRHFFGTMEDAGNEMPFGKCRLCLNNRELRDSHFLAAALYKMSRTPGDKNPNPVMVTKDVRVKTSKQLSDYLLCGTCEELFNTNGERYAMSQVHNGTRFPLLESLNSVTPLRLSSGGRGRPEFACYNQTTTPFIDRAQLAYFALSVFWRASVHQWEGVEQIDLGPFEEAFRTFLLGKTSFPANVMLMTFVCTDTVSQNSFLHPSPSNKVRQPYSAYSFLVRGILFLLYVGKLIPEGARRYCCFSSIDKWIFACDWEPKTLEAFARLFATSKDLVKVP